jgi:hypothetical protein
VGDASERPDPPSTWAKERCLASDSSAGPLVSPYGHPEPEQPRDLIGARLLGDSSQYRPTPPAHRVEADGDGEGSLLT